MHCDKSFKDASHDYSGIILTILTLLSDSFEEFASVEVLEDQVDVIH